MGTIGGASEQPERQVIIAETYGINVWTGKSSSHSNSYASFGAKQCVSRWASDIRVRWTSSFEKSTQSNEIIVATNFAKYVRHKHTGPAIAYTHLSRAHIRHGADGSCLITP